MMEWLSRVVVGGIRDLMDGARSKYGVDPVVFLVIYLGSVPFFYYSIFRMVRALARRRQNEIITWSTVFLTATVAPFLYVLFFGRNLPWWVYLVVALLIGQGVYSLVRRLRHKPAVVEEESKTPEGG
jgi:fatty acid desaturase